MREVLLSWLFEPVCMVSRESLWEARGAAQYGGGRA